MPDKNDKPVVNFAILQSVEDYVEKSGKFRTKCASFNIPGRDSGSASAVYIPYCDKQRFDFGNVLNDWRGHGVFTPPETGKPWEIIDFIPFREHFHDIHCPRPCRGYRNQTVVALFGKVWSRVFGAKLHQMPDDNPSTAPSVLKQAINAVPAVKYALGVGGIISVIAIVRGFRIDFRVALLGAVVMLVLMAVLLVFAKASARPQSTFKGTTFILTWFSLVLFMATATALFGSVFFGWPLDLRTLLAPVHAGQTAVEKHGTAEVLPPTTDRVDVTVKQAPSSDSPQKTETQVRPPTRPPPQREETKKEDNPRNTKTSKKTNKNVTAQRSETKINGNDNVTGNNIGGNGNVTGSSPVVSQGPCSVFQNGGNNNQANVNCGPPPVTVHWSVESTSTGQDGKPYVRVVLTVDHSLDVPAFMAECDRPCKTTGATAEGYFRVQKELFIEGHSEFAGFIFAAPRPLGPGVKVNWTIQSLDDTPPSIKKVSIVDPSALPASDKP